MRSIWTLLILNFLLCEARITQDDMTKAFLELTELGYEDECYEAAQAEWSFLNEPSNETRSIWEERLIAYANFKKVQKNEVQNRSDLHLTQPALKHKYEIIEKPGDALVAPEEYKTFVQFVATIDLLKATPIFPETARNYTYKDVEHVLSHSSSPNTKKSMWTMWHERFTPFVQNFSSNFDLLQKAAEENGATGVVEYWELLSGFQDGFDKMKYEWGRIEDLYKKVLNFARSSLAQKYKITLNGTIPAHLLGSLQADDWSPIAADVAPYPNIVYNIKKNLWKRKLIGRKLYKTASSMGSALINQVPQAKFWDTSEFDRQCPSTLINSCQNGVTRVSTCYEPTLSNFLTAHKNIGTVLFNQMSVEATPVLNIANRYSGLEQGISEFFGILSASPVWLNHTQLLDQVTEPEQRQIISLTITALNVLPRLAYYVAADIWRINAIEAQTYNATDLTDSWWKIREQYQGVTSDDTSLPTFLNDENIVRNKPYLPKFLGILLAFQMYEQLLDNTEVRYERLLEKPLNSNFIKMIQHGAADDWMSVLDKNLEIDDIFSSSLKSFFAPLEDFIDELDEDFEVKPDTASEMELEKVEAEIIKEINAPVTTTTTSTPRTTTAVVTKKRIISTTAVPKAHAAKPEADSSSKVMQDQPEVGGPNLDPKTAVPDDKSQLNSLTEEEENSEPKINTSKAVWAVGSVLLATIIICIIAIFGRQRCRKTPKNRRYV